MTTLITGATGFVGSAVLRVAIERGADVRVLARPGSDRRNIVGVNCEVAEGDLNELGSMREALKGCSSLFHVAADYRLWTPDPSELYRTNRDATVDLFRAAAEAGIGRIVYTSSVATLGINKDGTPADEETPVSISDMVGHYKRSKFVAEEAVTALIRDEGLPIVIVNPSTPVGPRDVKPTPTGRMIVEAASGRMPAYVDTGLNIAHADDVAEGHWLAFENGKVGERYILGGEDMTLREILGEITRIVGRSPPKVSLPRAPLYPLAYITEFLARLRGAGEPMLTVDSLRMSRKRMFFSSAKAQAELGYSARPTVQALQDAISWFRHENYIR